MAEESSENGYDVMWKLFGSLIILFIVITLAGRVLSDFNSSGSNSGTDQTNNQNQSSESSGGIFSFLESNPTIQLGNNVATNKEIDVYNQPAGEVIGFQEKNSFGRVIEGPDDRFNQTWWRIDFEKRPDGWVTDSDLNKNLFWPKIVKFFNTIFDWLRPFLVFISIILFALILWVLLKKRDLDSLKKRKEEFKEERKKSKENPMSGTISDLPVPNLPIGEESIQTENVSNKRWQNVQNLINSHSVNDWKQAIIEADVILEEMLEKMGYKGESIGDKLKQVEPSDFITLNSAWEAHKIRNLIAHKGSDYILSRDKAEDTINKYKEVFEEFYFI